jgi:hypothetical protein
MKLLPLEPGIEPYEEGIVVVHVVVLEVVAYFQPITLIEFKHKVYPC